MENYAKVEMFSNYIRKHKDELLEKYSGQTIVVGDPNPLTDRGPVSIVAVPDEGIAYYYGLGRYGAGNFAIKTMTEDEFRPKHIGLGVTLNG